MKNKRKLVFTILLVLLILANIGILSYYFANNREVQTGGSRISPDGNLVGYEQTSLNKKLVVLYQLALYDLKTKKTDYPFNKVINPADQPTNLEGFGKKESEVILTRGNVLSIFQKAGTGFEVIRIALAGSAAGSEKKEPEQNSGPLGQKGIQLGFRDVTINKPDRIFNMATRNELKTQNIPDRLAFGNTIVLNFEGKPYYLIIAEKQPQALKITEKSLTPTPLNETELQELKSLLPNEIAVYFYNPEEKLLAVLINCSGELDAFINNILGLPSKDKIVFVQNRKVLLFDLKKPGIEKEFSLKNDVKDRRLFRPFRQQIVCKVENESMLFVANGEEILEYDIDKSEEKIIAKPEEGIIHHVDSSADGSSLVVESFANGKNSIFLVNRESGASRLLVKDKKMFVNPAWYRASN